MSLKSVTSPEKNIKEIEFVIAKDAFDAAVTAAFKKNAAKMNVPGFRKGKAPRAIIEKMYGKGVFYEEAINSLLPDAYEAAEKEADIKPVSRPEFDIVSIDENGVTMKATVTVYPEVTLKKYKGLKAEKDVKPVTDEEVEAEINRVRERNAREIEVEDRPAQLGDVANIDYEGTVDGVLFEGGKDEGHDLKLGSGQFIPGFEEQIAGKKIGEEFDVNVTFPTEYHAEALAGKAAVFHCKLNALKFDQLPDADDDFAKDVSEFDTIAEYRADVRAKMEDANAHHAEHEIEEALIEELIKGLEADIPQVMIDSEVENQVRDFDNRLRQQGMELSMYLKYSGMTLDSMREQFKPMAEKQVKARLALEAVVKAEGITATEEEINEEIDKLAQAYHMEAEQIRSFLEPAALTQDITVQKAMKLIRDSAKITDKAEKAEKAENPAKATKTTKTAKAADKGEKTEKAEKAGKTEKATKTAKAKKAAEKAAE